MGNCIFLPLCNRIIICDEDEEHGGPKTLRVVAMDGKILEYRDPILVSRFLLGFHGCGIVSSCDLGRNLPADHEMQIGHLYYLVPTLPEESNYNGNHTRSRRITLVVTKKQLQELVRNAQLVGDAISNLPAGAVRFAGAATGKRSFVKAWTQILGTIHEEY